ncbi:hypothetical protein O3G_MSEX007920 [Manduca sexta]|uniref:COG4 transport protein middle alpha-helical bundle domain-containing protein n=2 Tax=Manduca sexta TaxID=7130 RepID=A0A921Z8F1_MANSE|nr:hypothetical protein O3G_MSEX007920 [Manduca sexta]
MATPQTGATTSTLVDDVFFIARKVIRRSISTGVLDGVCAVLNETSSSLERRCAGALRRWVRAPPPDPLPLAAPRPAAHAHALLDAAGDLAARLNRDLDAQRLLFLAHMSEAEAGAEWSERLATDAVQEGGRLARGAGERDKLASCAAGLAGAAESFRAAYDLARAALLAALKPKLLAWAEALADPGSDPEEMEDDADALPMALDQFVEAARVHISARATDALLYSMLVEIVTRAENRILHHHYDRVYKI